VFRERRFQIAGERNYFDGKSFQRGQQIEQFIRLAGIAQRENHVAVIDDAHVPVQRVHAVQHDAGRAGAGQCGGDFLPDVAGFADANDDNFAALLERADNNFDARRQKIGRAARGRL
jgi:hypothetical protein